MTHLSCERHSPLGPREIEVAMELLAGTSRKDIARRLRVSPKTVDAHRQNIWLKTGARNVAELRTWFARGLNRKEGA